MLISNKAYSNTISGQYNIGLGHCAFETLQVVQIMAIIDTLVVKIQ